jgi:hypothetical protein
MDETLVYQDAFVYVVIEKRVHHVSSCYQNDF